jgi:hypothetical protein
MNPGSPSPGRIPNSKSSRAKGWNPAPRRRSIESVPGGSDSIANGRCNPTDDPGAPGFR